MNDLIIFDALGLDTLRGLQFVQQHTAQAVQRANFLPDILTLIS